MDSSFKLRQPGEWVKIKTDKTLYPDWPNEYIITKIYEPKPAPWVSTGIRRVTTYHTTCGNTGCISHHDLQAYSNGKQCGFLYATADCQMEDSEPSLRVLRATKAKWGF